jgi:hypothetical protein
MLRQPSVNDAIKGYFGQLLLLLSPGKLDLCLDATEDGILAPGVRHDGDRVLGFFYRPGRANGAP